LHYFAASNPERPDGGIANPQGFLMTLKIYIGA